MKAYIVGLLRYTRSGIMLHKGRLEKVMMCTTDHKTTIKSKTKISTYKPIRDKGNHKIIEKKIEKEGKGNKITVGI